MLISGTILLQLVALAAPLSEAFFIDERQSPAMSEWNYNDQMSWMRMNRDCAGRAQSPIDIQQKNVIISQHLKLQFFNYNQQLKFKLSNAHHTIKMNPLGAGYDQLDSEARVNGNDLNSSSIHDIITADEYVEFVPTGTNNQQTVASSSAGLSNDENPKAALEEAKVGSKLSGANNGRLVSLTEEPVPTRKNKQGTQVHRQHTNAAGNQASKSMVLLPRASAMSLEPYGGAPTIKLDWLDDGNNEYKLRDIHFHWGERRDNGSEHAIDGRRAAMEMHLVHIKHGLDKSKIGFTSDSVAVIAVLIESHRKSNADFNPIVNELARINSTDQEQVIDYKSIYDLLPSNLEAFYTYSGSLTTPPCYQVVNWIVMAERLNMNAKQIEMFRNLYAPPHKNEEEEQERTETSDQHHKARDPYVTKNQSFQTLSAPNHGQTHSGNDGDNDDASSSRGSVASSEHHQQMTDMIMPNVRSIQELNNRTILASFTRHGGRLKPVLSYSQSIHSTIYNLPTGLSSLLLMWQLYCLQERRIIMN